MTTSGCPFLTTNQGLRIADNQNSLKAGIRGPVSLEDDILREKIMHFDHERIPERVVHARGSAAHGYFQAYDNSLAQFTKAKFLIDPSVQTPVFVRFSTVLGSRGSADTVRDPRGFATKFYTSEGNFDLVGNNMPVFFIQDAIKFPDMVHAGKPEPDNEVPQAQTAHDNFWDFISLTPESMHMVMWIMSDRALPRSYATMEGFGVHTFRLVNDKNESVFVKFHWKPKLGCRSLVWDEATKIQGKDPDFNRKDLWESIERGMFPEYELGLQIVPEADEHKFDFDLLDATKIIPEELVPVKLVGKMVLNRNPSNFFEETEQVAYHLGHIVPGIDFSNDPLLHGRLFSYLDTQLNRFNSANFAELPINRPIGCPVFNQQQDGFLSQRNVKSKINYEPSSLYTAQDRGAQATVAQGGWSSYPAPVEGVKIRARSDSFADHFSQAAMFYNSMTAPEKHHIVSALSFELAHVVHEHVRQRVSDLLYHVNEDLANQVAANIGIEKVTGDVSYLEKSTTSSKPNLKLSESIKAKNQTSPALSIELNPVKNATGMKVAILAGEGVSKKEFDAIKFALDQQKAVPQIIGLTMSKFKADDGSTLTPDMSLLTAHSVLFDAVVVPGGKLSVDALKTKLASVQFINEAFWHCKAIGGIGEGVELLAFSNMRNVRVDIGESTGGVVVDQGVITLRDSKDASNVSTFADAFVNAVAGHRFWGREIKDQTA